MCVIDIIGSGTRYDHEGAHWTVSTSAALAPRKAMRVVQEAEQIQAILVSMLTRVESWA